MQTGHCLCGDVRYEVDGEALNTSFCHCPSCKRAAGAPMTAWAMFGRDDVRFAGEPATTFASSKGVSRGFCGRCGTTISFEVEYMPGLIDITVASFDEPAAFAPTMHIMTRHREPWMVGTDALPAFEEFPPHDE